MNNIKYFKQTEGDKTTGFCVFTDTAQEHPKFPEEKAYDAIFVQIFEDGLDCTVTPGVITDEAMKNGNRYGKYPVEISKPEWLHITERVSKFLNSAEEYKLPTLTEQFKESLKVTQDTTSESHVN